MPQLAKSSRPSAVFLGGLVLVLAIWAVYSNSLHGPFVLDDISSIKNNLSLRRLWPPEFPTIGGMRGRPLVNFTLALNYAFGGTTVSGYHGFNLIVHSVAALFLYGATRRTLRLPFFQGKFETSADLIGFSAALLWALHPLQTEAVTYLSQRTESLMGFCYLLVIYAFVRAVESPDRLFWKILAVVACFSGMACKEVMVTAPVMVLLFDRTMVAGSFIAAWRERRGVYLGLASSWLALAGLMHGTGERGVGFSAGVSSQHYALTESRVVLLYLKLAAWPHPLIFDYGSRTVASAREVWPYVLAVTAGIAGVLLALRHRPVLGFLLAWPLLALAPTSSFVPLALQPMAEHRMYLPLAGLAVLVAVGLHRLLGEKFWLLTVATALVLGGVSYRRNAVYRDEIGLWSDTVEKSPDNDRAHLNLGLACLGAGRTNEATLHFERALAMNPENFQALSNLGYLRARVGQPAEAIEFFKRSLLINGSFAEAHYNLGCVLLDAGDKAGAQRGFEHALALNPDHSGAHNNLATILASTGNYAEAIGHYTEALRIDPSDAEIYANRAYASYQMGKVRAAIADYEQALVIRPAFTDARRNLELLQKSISSTRH